MKSGNVTELGDDFDLQIRKGRWVVDFWSDWCVSPNSSIYLNPLNSKLASEIKVDDNIISFDNGLVRDKIIKTKISGKLGHCKRIITSSGRTLEVTDDHSFFSNGGWIDACKLKVNDKIAILPVVDPVDFNGEEEILLDENDFNPFREDYKNLDNYLEELKRRGLLPLKKNSPKLPILSRFVGALFSDGSLYNGKKNNYREISFSLGQKQDVDEIVYDLHSLGFDKTHEDEKSTGHVINGRSFFMHTFRVKCLSTALYLLFRALGVPEGNKTNVSYILPKWIKNGGLLIKREFLSAYLGGDGPKVNIIVEPRKDKNPYNGVKINDIEFHKRADLTDSGISLANDIADLLKEFNIELGSIFYELNDYKRKDGSTVSIIHVKIKSNFNNAFILTQKLGYAYCWQKQLSGMYAGEFIREILLRRKKWHGTYEEVINSYRGGISSKEIAKKLGLDEITVYNWTNKNVKPTIKRHNIKYDSWLMEASSGLKDGFIWSNIEKIEEINLPKVSVMTTEKTHNFIANGFLVHNCNPCKIMDPHFKEAAKELKGKVNFGKVDVESNHELSSRFEVMGIPTTIFFEDGEIVNRVVGAIDKENIIKLVRDSFNL